MNEKQVLIVAKDQFALKRLSDEAMREILPAYTQSINRIIEELRNLPEDSLTREMWLKSQLTTMERQLSQVSEQVLRVLPPKLVEAFEEGLKNAEQYLVAGGIEPPVPQQQLVGATTGGQRVTQQVNQFGIPVVSDPSLVSAVNPLGEFIQPSITRQQVLAAAQDRGFKEFLTGETGANRKGYSLQELLSTNTKRSVDDVAAIMREGFLTGRSNEEIARRVGDVFGGPKNKSVAMTNAVVRTGMAEASQAAHEMFYDANKDLLPKVPGGYKFEWDASNDTRLCEECAPLDGLRFKERDDAPAWPVHWSCRCKIVPITATEAQMREDGDVPEGSFLERQEVTYSKDGKRNPPPPGYEPVKRGGTAYSRPQKQNGKMYWVRRVDMGKGKVYAGDMLQKMGRSGNFDSQRAILGNRATVERFNALTKSGAKYANDPQAAVRLLLSGNSSPPPGSIKPFFSGKRK